MSRIATLIICAVAFSVSFAITYGIASCDDAYANSGEIENIAPSTDPLLEYALTPAAAYWSARGEHLPSKPELVLYDEQGDDRFDIAARAAKPGTRIYWNRVRLEDTELLQNARDPWRAMAREALLDICQTTAHEYGHNLGHDHTDVSDLHNYDLMAPDSGSTIWTLTDGTKIGGYIPECKTWAKTILDARAKRTRARLARSRR
jgi:hypothetical protein